VTGNDKPLTLNTELFELAAVTVTFAPLAVSLPDAVPLAPTTLSIPKVFGKTVSCLTTSILVPLREMLAVAFEASLATVAVASNAPQAFGTKLMPIDIFRPAARVTGRVGEVSRKVWLEIATLLIVIEELPEFVAEKVIRFVPPTGTFPKLMLVLPSIKLLGSDLLEGVVCWLELSRSNPWQPIRKVRTKTSESVSVAF